MSGSGDFVVVMVVSVTVSGLEGFAVVVAVVFSVGAEAVVVVGVVVVV